MMPMIKENTDQLLTFKEVKERLRISERTLRRLTAEGKIEFVRINGSIKFRSEGIKEYIEKHIIDADS